MLADTHGRPHPDALGLVAALAPDAILHAGDLGDPGCLAPFAALAPLHAVRGNIDPPGAPYPDALRLVIADAAGATRLSLLLLHIAVYGPRLRAEIHRDAVALGADLVVCGHSHTPLVARDRGVAVFNPGSVGPRRFGLPITFGVLDVSARGVAMRHIDCTTGAAWDPPRP